MFEGVSTAVITPFREGKVDEKALRELVEWQIGEGIDGLVPCGSTGESATLSHEEHNRVIEVVVDAAAGRVPVIAGTGSNNTREAIALTQHAKEVGADGALLISPYYNKPTPRGLVEHYAAVAKAASFPIVYYNIPGRTGSNIGPETQAEIAALEHVVGVKEASGDVVQMAEVVRRVPSSFAVLSGDDAMTLPLLSVGGKGVISTSSNVAPAEMLAMVRAFNEGDTAEATRIHLSLLPLFGALFCETNPVPLKAAMAMLGRCSDEIRLPLTKPEPESLERIESTLRSLGYLN